MKKSNPQDLIYNPVYIGTEMDYLWPCAHFLRNPLYDIAVSNFLYVIFLLILIGYS